MTVPIGKMTKIQTGERMLEVGSEIDALNQISTRTRSQEGRLQAALGEWQALEDRRAEIRSIEKRALDVLG